MRRTLPAPAPEAFALLADLRGHHRWIPLTTTDAPPPPARRGDVLTAVTAGFFPDRMRVEHVRHPDAVRQDGELRVRKLGPVLLGDVTITVTPAGPGTCVADWREDVWLRGPLPRALTRLLLTPVLEGMTALALRKVERHLAGSGT
ncbi:polyketide cyclase/dehydrase/lipid transport protein [Georgenia soli]|uniref:Polyketide cyclase/dehydrase/lipid transport protein n=1 Tax=Georgenia soli TaxID=638953 RepID=A0A2A9EL02_9MICO|nr:SRPBCC family protein [Georgenia soli]PFG38920.1 polyketide cyclase/dehydrase/lipid transport protein [Georgenia soli]